MESFVLSETLKVSQWNVERASPADDIQYLFLLFDPTTTPLRSNKVFTTEGHVLSLPHTHLQAPTSTATGTPKRGGYTCPVYTPPTLGGLVVGIERRADYEYARSLVFGKGVDGRVIEDKARVHWYEGGYCEIPVVPRFVGLVNLP
jgi:mannosidase alpha-like ER degradation enhancer 1